MPESNTPDTAREHLDLTLLEELHGLLEDDFQDLIVTFLEDANVRIQDLEEAVSSGEAEAIRQYAHSFKGSTLNVGAIRIASLCRKLEDLARSGELGASTGLLDQIKTELVQVDHLMRSRYL